MKNTFLIAMILALASSAFAAAVEVTVKTPTKLYDSTGKVICQVPAGHPFQAHKASGKWVYGLLRTRRGSARGWIPLAALHLDDDTKRKLAASSNTRKTTPTSREHKPTRPGAILLRYRPNPGELQVYELNLKIDTETTGAKHTMGVRETMEGTVWMQCSIKCKSRDADGTYLGELEFHRFRLRLEITDGDLTVRFKGDEKKARIHVNGSLVFSGKWGSSDLGGIPDLSQEILTRHAVRVNDRGEVLEIKNVDPSTEGLFDDSVGSFFEVSYPEKPVCPGDSWLADKHEEVDDPAVEGRTIDLVGQAKYTALEHAIHCDRRCLKIHSEVKLSKGQSWQRTRSDSFVDEVTGLPFYTVATVSEELVGSAKGTRATEKSSRTLTIRYKGNKLKE